MPRQPMPAQYCLKPNHSCRTPNRSLFVHTTRAGAGAPGRNVETVKIEWACSLVFRRDRPDREGDTLFYHSDPAGWWEFLRSLCDPKQCLWVYAHRAFEAMTLLDLWAELDAQRVWQHYKGDNDNAPCDRVNKGDRSRPGYMVLNDKPFIASLKCGRGRFKVVDVRNYMDKDMSELCAEFTPYLSGEEKRCPGFRSTKEGSFAGCRVVGETILNMYDFWRDIDGGVWRPTASGLAWSNFRHRHMKHSIVCHSDREALEVEKASYYGGVVECNFRGEVIPPWEHTLSQPKYEGKPGRDVIHGPVYQVDVSSMYPSVMLDNVYPIRLIGRDYDVRPSDLQSRMRCYGAVAEVTLNSPATPYPVRVRDSTMYKTGSFGTVLAGPELGDALGKGLVTNVLRVCYYSVARIFAGYSAYWLDMRHYYKGLGQEAYERFCKLMGVSIYGRFGMRKNMWQDRPFMRHHKRWDAFCKRHAQKGKTECYRTIAGYVQQLVRDEYADGAFPAVASYVTSYGRLLLRRLQSACRDGSVLYTDTDGFIVTAEGYSDLVGSGELAGSGPGSLRLVRSYTSGEILGCRAYSLDGAECHAGLPRDAIKVSDTCWSFISPESPEEVFRRCPDGTVRLMRKRFTRGSSECKSPVGRRHGSTTAPPQTLPNS